MQVTYMNHLIFILIVFFIRMSLYSAVYCISICDYCAAVWQNGIWH